MYGIARLRIYLFLTIFLFCGSVFSLAANAKPDQSGIFFTLLHSTNVLGEFEPCG